ncbi:GerW family sporulation protein [Desulforamulus ruminis]|uniref:Sporulation protein YtfJ n=1 Tax=Desulforamulus ruminis (strain ATCC 23193 / DSM 2154 / NCIMB 8452 / DL) TaxID=696281 RepID=F6DL92_DESRL|nr:GerW family sporulation protein [Desulforamulus ruminis]AEG59313.1 Sporulation protein YtfJ [Desulforamulus ruminis DSM 2154]
MDNRRRRGGVGGGEGNEPNKGAGKGSGAGAKINAGALIVIQEGEAKVYSLSQKGTLEKIAEMIPEAITKFTRRKRVRIPVRVAFKIPRAAAKSLAEALAAAKNRVLFSDSVRSLSSTL